MTMNFLQPPVFVFGITGAMALNDASSEHQQAIRLAIRRVFDRLEESESKRTSHERTEQKSLDWSQSIPQLGLKEARRCLLTSLAPGADTLGADVAREKQFEIVGCLPFPEDVYPATTSFVWTKSRIDRSQDLEQANAERQQTIRAWLDDGLSDKFFVPLCEESHEEEECIRTRVCDRFQTCSEENVPETEEERRRERYLRYRAAGEYIATHSHILLAVVPHTNSGSTRSGSTRPGTKETGFGNPFTPTIRMPVLTSLDEANDIPSGASTVIAAKQNGMTPGLLSQDPAFVWGSNGPVIEIRYSEEWLTKTNNSPEELADQLTCNVVFPLDTISINTPDKDNDARDAFSRLAENLTQFQKHFKIETKVPPPDGFDAMTEFVASRCLRPDVSHLDKETAKTRKAERVAEVRDLFDADRPEHIRFLARFNNLWRVRDIAAASSRTQVANYNRTLYWMFLLTILAAVCLHIASHWHAAHTELGSHAATADVNAKSSDEIAADGASPEQTEPTLPASKTVASKGADSLHDNQAHPSGQRPTLQIVMQSLALIFASAAIFLFLFYRSSKKERIRYDHRALAEGLRVQGFWFLAGLGDSVPASYMQRQRGEMDWFRRAISSLAAPYHRWQGWFQSISHRKQCLALSYVAEAWLAEQYRYMAKEFYTNAKRLHFHHISGRSLAFTGLLFALLGLLHHMNALGANVLLPSWLSVGGVLVMSAIAIAAWIYGIKIAGQDNPQQDVHWGDGAKKTHHREAPLPHIPDKNNRDRFVPKALESFYWIWNLLEHYRIWPLRYSTLVLTLFTYGFLMSQAIPVLLHSTGVPAPSPAVMWALSSGVYLLLGAMSVAYAEKNLLSEHAMQYNAMATMCRAAYRRILGHLEQLEPLLDELDHRKEHGHASTSKGEISDQLLEARIQAHIRSIQSLLKKSGQQFLDENAEWLILHRSRPMEPVMAG